MRPLVAHCHMGLGKLYRRLATRHHAMEHLAIAPGEYRGMEMRLWAEEQVEAELRRPR
jgi:hypothetical protein